MSNERDNQLIQSFTAYLKENPIAAGSLIAALFVHVNEVMTENEGGDPDGEIDAGISYTGDSPWLRRITIHAKELAQ